MIKNQVLEKIVYKIDIYFIKNNITITKLCIAQISPIETLQYKQQMKKKSRSWEEKIFGQKY